MWRVRRRWGVETLTRLWGSPWRAVTVGWTGVEAVGRKQTGRRDSVSRVTDEVIEWTWR